MSRGNIMKKPLGRILFWTICIVLAVAVCTAGSISYAKYISSENMNDHSDVANMGVELFELQEHGVLRQNVDLTQVVPGADIDGPHIRLKINSEVSYTLFLRIIHDEFPESYKYIDEEGVENVVDTVYYTVMKDQWTLYEAYKDGDKYVEVYQFVVSNENGEKDHVFKASTPYNYTYYGEGAMGEITVLLGDVIYISQYYDYTFVRNQGHTKDFTISFEAFIRQVM